MRKSHEQRLITKEHIATYKLLTALYSSSLVIKLFKCSRKLQNYYYTTISQSSLHTSLPLVTPIFKTESLRLVSNIQLVECLLL